jgi:hypothetical protein
MKVFSLLMALSFLAPAAFAENSNVADRLTDLSCQYPDPDLGGLDSIVNKEGGISLIAGWIDENQDVRAGAYNLTWASFGVGDQEGLTLKGTGPDGDLDLLLDVKGKAQFYSLNGSTVETKGLTCTVYFKDKK